MKKLFLSVTTSLIACFSLSAQLLCGTYDDFDAKFHRVGAFHNALMDNIRNNFTPSRSVKTKPDAIDFIRDYNKDYYQQHESEYFPVPLPPVEINNNFESSKGYVDFDKFKVGLFTQGSGISLDECFTKISKANLLDAGNLELFQGTINILKNANAGASTDQLENDMVGLANNWFTLNEGKNGNGKELTGNILAVGLKSCEWWNQNHGAALLLRQMNETEDDIGSGPFVNYQSRENMFLLFPWLADLAGAVVSAAIYSVVSGANFSLEKLGQASLGGAISSSAGLVGKVVNWFKNIF